MCGIALVLSGDCLVVAPSTAAAAEAAASGTPFSDEGKGVSVGELKEALRRRGPDSLGCHRFHLCADGTIVGATDGVDCDGGDKVGGGVGATELCFIGATLQLRGAEPVSQPLVAQSGSVLVYNGEIYGGINIANDQNDTQSLLSSLESCCCCDLHVADRDEAYPCRESVGKSVPRILSTIKGPWALIYWQTDSKTLWFGRDAFGRRSLLVHWPTPDDSRFILSSVSPPSFSRNNSATEVSGLEAGADPDFSDHTKVCYWEELPCGIYSIHLKDLDNNAACTKEGCVVRKHDWTDSSLHTLIRWERKSTVPTVDGLISAMGSVDKGNHHLSSCFRNSREAEDSTSNGFEKRDLPSDICLSPAHRVLIALSESVMLRTNVNILYQGDLNKLEEAELAPIAILFSGGLDSMILAALLDQCLDSKWTIDLLNVSFDGQLAPDRVSSLAGLKELQRISPLRRWRLVEIDSNLANLKEESEHVMSLIYPSNTYMDLNIGVALWLAASGDGWVNGQDGDRYKHKSTSRVLLVGSGADEQCAGYGRHRTKYRVGGWVSLDEEMRLDVQRIWKRNMGRDDRCISDHGKEARFPFLDESVIRTLLEIPLWDIAKLDEPVGKGDKKILREVAKLLGLQEAAFLPKRAIQFGSRIARESNRKNFGSNRAANLASAGSVEVHKRNH
ncbi:asparagine synthetase domain-containing protein 1-like [Triticum dicoccoides]|uniref:asparagine synthetase domain-containing protein 1-like n=1 Tax=Triticum dicoccoides TaxID=85692 RepID=UPI00188E2C75|nr:asparagine synthetase domain-containing protein 1-like [Triticum dicoccoides]